MRLDPASRTLPALYRLAFASFSALGSGLHPGSGAASHTSRGRWGAMGVWGLCLVPIVLLHQSRGPAEWQAGPGLDCARVARAEAGQGTFGAWVVIDTGVY